MFDLGPATTRMRDVLSFVTDEQLELPTPCPDLRVGDLVDHVGMFAVVFQAAARKQTTADTSPPPADVANLEPGWRARIAADLDDLARTWREPASWQGSTWAGGVELPAEVMGLVALDELVVHGWDLAIATSQAYAPSPQEVAAALAFVDGFDAPRDGALFGPIVPVDAEAPAMHRLLGLTGRDPRWRPPA